MSSLVSTAKTDLYDKRQTCYRYVKTFSGDRLDILYTVIYENLHNQIYFKGKKEISLLIEVAPRQHDKSIWIGNENVGVKQKTIIIFIILSALTKIQCFQNDQSCVNFAVKNSET